jgi:hypothetical protein
MPRRLLGQVDSPIRDFGARVLGIESSGSSGAPMVCEDHEAAMVGVGPCSGGKDASPGAVRWLSSGVRSSHDLLAPGFR